MKYKYSANKKSHVSPVMDIYIIIIITLSSCQIKYTIYQGMQLFYIRSECVYIKLSCSTLLLCIFYMYNLIQYFPTIKNSSRKFLICHYSLIWLNWDGLRVWDGGWGWQFWGWGWHGILHWFLKHTGAAVLGVRESRRGRVLLPFFVTSNHAATTTVQT